MDGGAAVIGFLRAGIALMVLAAATAGSAHAKELCGWLTERVEADGLHQFDLWLEADSETAIFYKMTGRGVVTESSQSYLPGSGTVSLHAGKAVRVWGFGTTLTPPADIEIIGEIHAPPASVFSEDETPMLAAFDLRRHVPEEETALPSAVARRRCVVLAPPPDG
jgi:hypothetical protein